MGVYKFNKDSIWKYFEGTYKVFIPKLLIADFERFAKANKIQIKISGKYNYIDNRAHKKDIKEDVLREGADYIFNADNEKSIKTWLKKAYKGI